MTKEQYLQLNSDLDSLKKYNDFPEIKTGDSALYSRIIDYKKNGLMSLDDMMGLLGEDKTLPDSSLLLSKKDSLEKEAYKPVVATVEKPVEKSAMETLYGTVFPRLSKRTDEGIVGTGGTLVAGVLDAASLIPRISSNIQQAPIALSNMVQSNKPPQQALKEYFSNIGDTQGKSFQTLNAPEWLPDIVQTAANKMQPINQGIGEFITSVARGPLLPGMFGKNIATGVVGKMSPGLLKTALDVAGNAGTGAALGTSESIARGEGVDPLGATLGGVLGGGLTYLPYQAASWSDKKTGNILLDARNEIINDALGDVRLAQNELDAAKNQLNQKSTPKTQRQLDEATKKVQASQKNYDDVFDVSVGKKSRQYWEKHPEELSQYYTRGLNERASKFGYVGNERPRSLMDALSIYSPKRNPTLTTKEIDNAIPDLNRARQASQSAGGELGARAAAGKLGALFQLGDLYRGETYLPEQVLRQLPDATVVNPSLIRGGNMLKDYLTNFSQQDSTKR